MHNIRTHRRLLGTPHGPDTPVEGQAVRESPRMGRVHTPVHCAGRDVGPHGKRSRSAASVANSGMELWFSRLV
ncbi:hypothetical protein ACOMHN_057866 [Nucella lapillus]